MGRWENQIRSQETWVLILSPKTQHCIAIGKLQLSLYFVLTCKIKRLDFIFKVPFSYKVLWCMMYFLSPEGSFHLNTGFIAVFFPLREDLQTKINMQCYPVLKHSKE